METTKTVLAPGERITVIDALRGFSLIGICLIHSMQHFGAMGTMTSQAVFPWEGTMNEIFSWLINYLVFGKFFIIFSCLFGLSFFIQMDRAAKKGLDFRPRFLWRLVLLLAIGYLHGLIVRVDILLIYAILGFVLVLMYKWPTKLLAGITLYLFLGGATLVPVAYKSLTAPAVEQVEERMAERPASRPAGPRKVQTLSETIESNAWDGIVGKMRFQVSSGRIYLTLGLFIVGRIRLFERMDEFRGRLNRWALLALAGLGLLYVARSYLPPVAWGEVSFYSWMSSTTTNLINLLTAYLWVIVVMEGYRLQKVQRAMALRAYGLDELYCAVRDRCLYFFRFRVGLESSGCFLERIGLSCLYGCSDSVQPLLAEEVPLWTDGVVVEDRNLYEMAAVGTVNSLISPIVIVVVIIF